MFWHVFLHIFPKTPWQGGHQPTISKEARPCWTDNYSNVTLSSEFYEFLSGGEGQTLASVWKLNILLLGGLCPLSSTGETPSSSLKPLPLILFCNDDDDDDGDSDGEWRWWWCYGQSGERHLQECRIIPHYPPPTLKRTPSIHNPQSSLSPSLSSSVSQ